jgi:hypothetical protein
MFNDAELMDVCVMLGVFWQRRDLIHLHHHAMRTPGPTPKFLEFAYSKANWDTMKALYERRKAAGFPGHEPLP